MEGSVEPFTPGLFVPNYTAQPPVPNYMFQSPMPNYAAQPFFEGTFPLRAPPIVTGMPPPRAPPIVTGMPPPRVSPRVRPSGSRKILLKAPPPKTTELASPKTQIEKKDALSYEDYKMDAGVEKELRKKASDRRDGDKHDGDRLVKFASMISANLNRLEKNGEYVIEKARTLGEASKIIRYSVICVDRLSGYEKSYFTLGGTLYELPYGDDINLSEYLVAELSRRIRMREDHKVVCDSSRLAYLANNRSFEPKFYEHRIHPSK